MKKLMIVFIYTLSPILIMVMLYTNNESKYTSLNSSLPMVLGVLSYTWMLWQLILSARPKFIERHFGLDKMYRFHVMIALVSILFAYGHKLNKELLFKPSTLTWLGGSALNIFIGVSVISIVFMWTKVQNKIKILRTLSKGLKKLKVLTYEKLKIVHNLTILAVVLMQVHVLMTSAAKESVLIFNVYMFYFLIAVGFYVYHISIKVWLLEEKRYTVASVTQENPNTISIELTPNTLYTFDYKPGQFAYFTFNSNDLPNETHPFSISSSPTDKSKLSFTAKNLGDFTNRLNHICIGDQVFVEGPFGGFSHVENKSEESTVFLAGGIGITPIMSMIDYIASTDPNREVVLIWAVRTQSDFIKYKHFKDLEQEMTHFKFIPIVSKGEQWSGLKGRLDRVLLKETLLELSYINASTGFYICGSPNFMESVLMNLNSLGIPRKQVYYEKFTV